MKDIEKELMKQLPKELQQQFKMPKNLKDGNAANMFKFKGTFSSGGQSSSSTTQTDPQTGNRYTFKKTKKKKQVEQKQVEVYDPAGKLLYDGPYNSDVDKASVPDEYRDFIKKLDKDNTLRKGNKIELKLGQ